jgi:DNA-binding Lrp family transcriptional regulator
MFMVNGLPVACEPKQSAALTAAAVVPHRKGVAAWAVPPALIARVARIANRRVHIVEQCRMAIKLDALDSALLSALAADPRVPILELASRLSVARNTVQARMKRLEESGLVRGYPPNINLAELGFAVHAFVGIETDQNKMNDIIEALRAVPYVLEVHATTGRADLLVRIAAQTQGELLSLIQDVHRIDGVKHSETMLAMATPVEYRSLPLVQHLTQGRAK